MNARTDIAIIQLLADELKNRKQRNPQYSLRAFAAALSVSPAQLSQILSGKRHLTIKCIQKIANNLALSPSEQDHYIKNWSMKKTHFEKEPSAQRERRLMKDDEFKVISEWFHFAILSLAQLNGAMINFEWISERLGISVTQAKESVQRLQRMNILGPGPELKRIAPPLSVVSDIPSQAIRSYHQKVIVKALEQLENIPVERRDFSAITMPILVKNMTRYRQLIEKFQDDLLELSSSDSGQEVYIFSCQLVPAALKERKV